MPDRTEKPPVFIVDDDAAMRRTIEDILELDGYPAFSAATGSDAEEMFERSPCPVSIVDLRLPDTDGLDLARRFRRYEPHMQAIIVTGNASVESAISAVRDHGCDYLVKPVRPPELLRTVAAAEDRWRLKATEENLERSESLLKALFEASPLPHIVLDWDLRIRLWNEAAERVFGWTAEEVTGKRPPMAAGPEGADSAEIFAAVLGGRPCTAIEVKRRRTDGTVLDMLLSAAAVIGTAGTPSAVLAVYEDITERRRIEENLQHAQRLDAVGRLAGGIAHDFNNLLAVIRTELDLVLIGDELAPHLRESVQAACDTADRGARLTRQLLSFARREPMESAIVAANEVVADLERMLTRLIMERVQLELILCDDEAFVNVDRGKLEQVLTNLVVNARDAIEDSGRITISTATGASPPGGASDDLDDGGWVTISVTDTGGGIAVGLRSRIFEPFFTTKEAGAGTGLGLATSFGIVQGMGGMLTLDSEVGRGSTFHVSLPRASSPAPAGEAEQAGGVPTGTETILLVEDNPALRDVAQRILVRQGYTVYPVADSVEATRLLEEMERVPDLMFVDAHLPNGDGRDLARDTASRYPQLRFLLTSGSYDLVRRETGEVPLLRKPYTIDGVARAVRLALDGALWRARPREA